MIFFSKLRYVSQHISKDMLFINENLSTEEFGALREDLENVFNEDSELTLNMSPEEKIDFSLNFYTDAVNAKEDTDY